MTPIYPWPNPWEEEIPEQVSYEVGSVHVAARSGADDVVLEEQFRSGCPHLKGVREHELEVEDGLQVVSFELTEWDGVFRIVCCDDCAERLDRAFGGVDIRDVPARGNKKRPIGFAPPSS